ncbi:MULTISPECIES: fatty acid desaturase family protein [unclassified Thermosynechococcus]|uniref:fatty acid desaturase family protein n=1 Tax=unclassified Thermosynechococcus TaxID=2622553 RepID=UPI0019F950FF|nr:MULTISPECIES: fatty acid desaturase family protein [unclassified Thermosynechococcus]HIK35912.1 fatty acid desaturase family protein [Thermosynechococcus sp. M98_K2018_005]HIK48124.1 fatty acid desaturase family protein [Thermosynechococcus sp. M55_K2018_012]
MTRSASSPSLLSIAELQDLNQRSNWAGLRQLTLHLGIILVSDAVWLTQLGERWWLAIPALFLCGTSLATMFATLHECSHRTAFASQRLNDAVASLAGLLCFYNSDFYRRYHKWHHRYTQIPGKDPELDDPKPTNWWEYLWELSGLPWWWGKLQTFWNLLLGHWQRYPYITPEAGPEVIRSARMQLLVYGGAIALSVALGYPWFVLAWVVPLAVGQPVLRFILLAEHTNCSNDNNGLTNTRTTLTLWPIRLLMWNMPYHTEHHLYPSIPFHALAKAHTLLKPHLGHCVSGYFQAHRQIVAQFKQA